MTHPVRIRLANCTLAGDVSGPEGARWVVLLHALSASRAMWEGLMPALTAQHRVLRLDARGHGESTAAPAPYRMHDLVGDVVSAMDQFDIAKADVVGLSMGGMTALGLALDHPGRVRRAICANGRAAFPPPVVAAWGARAAAVAEGGLAAVVEDTLSRWFTPATTRTRPAVIEAVRRMILATSPEGFRGCALALQGLDYDRRLGEISVPTLYLCGALDGAAPPDVMQAMATATPGASLTILPEAAHLSNIEAPEPFAAAVLGFLQPEVGA